MANSLNGRQWRFDTTVAAGLPAYPIRIKNFLFMGYTGAADKVVITDKKGVTIAILSGDTSLEEVRSDDFGWIDGLGSVTLTLTTVGQLTMCLG